MVWPIVLLIFLAALIVGGALTAWLHPTFWRAETQGAKRTAATRHMSDAAIASLLFSGAALIYYPFGILGLILGFQALKEIRRDSTLIGIWIACAGITLNALIFGAFALFALYLTIQGKPI